MEYSQLTLEQVKYDFRALMTREAMANSEVYVHRLSDAAQMMEIQVRRAVWAHKLHTEERKVYVQGSIPQEQVPESVLIALRGPWWRKLATIIAAWRGRLWCDVVGRAVIPAIEDEPIPVSGTALVEAESFYTFPGMPMPRYPDMFGPPYCIVRTSEPHDWYPEVDFPENGRQMTPEQHRYIKDVLHRANTKIEDDL